MVFSRTHTYRLIIIESCRILNLLFLHLIALFMLVSSRMFNIIISVSAVMSTVGTLKKMKKLYYFNSIFNSICICIQEVASSSFLISFFNSYSFLNNYTITLIYERYKRIKISRMRDLYI